MLNLKVFMLLRTDGFDIFVDIRLFLVDVYTQSDGALYVFASY
jgi:hypothetical protein